MKDAPGASCADEKRSVPTVGTAAAGAFPTRSRPLRMWLWFLLTSVGFTCWRGSEFIVWDDTSSASFNRYANNSYFSWSNPDLFSFLLRDGFDHVAPDGYRPLSYALRGLGAAWFSRDQVVPYPFVVVTGILLGLWAVVLWLL